MKALVLVAAVALGGCASGEFNWQGAAQGLSHGLIHSSYGQVQTYPPAMIPQPPIMQGGPVVLPQRPQRPPCCR
jgi:hypothetical protein